MNYHYYYILQYRTRTDGESHIQSGERGICVDQKKDRVLEFVDT